MRSADSSLSGVKQKKVHRPLWMRQLRAVVRSCEELCHKCDTKPVSIDKIDDTDATGLLIRSREKGLLEGPEALEKLASMAKHGRYRNSIIEDARMKLEVKP